MLSGNGQLQGIEEIWWRIFLFIAAAVLFFGVLRITTGTFQGCSKYISSSKVNPRECVESEECRLVDAADPITNEGNNYYVRCKTAVHSPHINCEGMGCSSGSCVGDESNKNYGTCKSGNNYYMCRLG